MIVEPIDFSSCFQFSSTTRKYPKKSFGFSFLNDVNEIQRKHAPSLTREWKWKRGRHIGREGRDGKVRGDGKVGGEGEHVLVENLLSPTSFARGSTVVSIHG